MADTVLVTGACGFIAPYIVAELARKGYSVRATDLPDANFRDVEACPAKSPRPTCSAGGRPTRS